MNGVSAVVLGVIEGVTEFLPVSSTAHLTIAEALMGMKTDAPAVTAFTAVIQMGAILAAVVYFRRDIRTVVTTWFRGLVRVDERRSPDALLGWYVIAGTIPIGLAGYLGRNVIKHDLRSLWYVVAGLVLWSIAIVYAERTAAQRRDLRDMRLPDAVFIGVIQVLALVPGVSRSGATISAGLRQGFDRVAATRFSFLLAIPALLAAGIFELKDAVGTSGVSVASLVVGTGMAFLTAYASIAWLLRFVAHHSLTNFVWYRVTVAVFVVAALTTGLVHAV